MLLQLKIKLLGKLNGVKKPVIFIGNFLINGSLLFVSEGMLNIEGPITQYKKDINH